MDFAITNEASEVFVDAQLDYFLARPLEINSTSLFGVKAPNTPAFSVTEREKGDKYRHIEHLANVAYQMELTQSKPVFLYPVISARGHLNRDFVTLIDWLAEQRAKHVVAMGVRDGVSFSNRKAGFRNAVLDRLVRILLKINTLWGNLDAGTRQRGKTARGKTAGPDQARGRPRGPPGPGPPSGPPPATQRPSSPGPPPGLPPPPGPPPGSPPESSHGQPSAQPPAALACEPSDRPLGLRETLRGPLLESSASALGARADLPEASRALGRASRPSSTRQREPQRRVIASVAHLNGLPEGEQATVSPTWAKGESQGVVDQAFSTLTPSPASGRVRREGSGDTWRNRPRDSPRGLLVPQTPDQGLRAVRCWAGGGIEISHRAGGWSIGKPQTSTRGRACRGNMEVSPDGVRRDALDRSVGSRRILFPGPGMA